MGAKFRRNLHVIGVGREAQEWLTGRLGRVKIYRVLVYTVLPVNLAHI